jgi:hypothetical protein
MLEPNWIEKPNAQPGHETGSTYGAENVDARADRDELGGVSVEV